jgi:hypothetical protein
MNTIASRGLMMIIARNKHPTSSSLSMLLSKGKLVVPTLGRLVRPGYILIRTTRLTRDE